MLPTSLLAVSILVLVHTRIASCGIVDDQACAKYMHQQCKCEMDFDEFDNKKGTQKFCKKLQSCANCMAIPRCQSNYEDQFRKLLRTTLVMGQYTNICPNVNYKSFDLGSLKACKANGRRQSVYDHCGNRCDCVDGRYTNCFRVRKEFTQMNFRERRWFVNAYYKATTDRFLKDDFHKILAAHSQVPTNFLHHMPQIFFPWHRWFLLKAENFLRQIDCRVTIPYFQWTAAGKNVWRTTNPKDVWSGGPQGLGGNGVPPSYCVKDGKFREGNWHLPVSIGGGCLKRNFDKTCKLFTEKKLHKLFRSKSFKKFEKIVREELHSAFHDCIGGDMPDNAKAGNTPEVLLHHAFMDKIWDQWQSRSEKHKYQYFTTLNSRMPMANLYPWQILNNENLPGYVGVAYQEFKTRKKPRSPRKQGDEREDFLEPTDQGEVTDEEEMLPDEVERLPKGDGGRLQDEEERPERDPERLPDEEERLERDGGRLPDEEERPDRDGGRLPDEEERPERDGGRLPDEEERPERDRERLPDEEERLETGRDGRRLPDEEERPERDGGRRLSDKELIDDDRNEDVTENFKK